MLRLTAAIQAVLIITTLWKEGDVSEQNGRAIKQYAVLKTGQTLIVGRNAHSSNPKFGKWLGTLNLDYPFNDRRERFAAMRIAKLFTDESILVTSGINESGINDEDRLFIDESRLVNEKFRLCPHARPNDMWTWARKAQNRRLRAATRPPYPRAQHQPAAPAPDPRARSAMAEESSRQADTHAW
jgi:hypothetical protein